MEGEKSIKKWFCITLITFFVWWGIWTIALRNLKIAFSLSLLFFLILWLIIVLKYGN